MFLPNNNNNTVNFYYSDVILLILVQYNVNEAIVGHFGIVTNNHPTVALLSIHTLIQSRDCC